MINAPRERALVEIMRCPACEAALDFIEGAPDPSARCLGCGALYPLRGGIWRMLTPEQQARYAAFVSGYQAIRMREGWERSAEYYLHLPDVPASDPTAPVWRIRRRSLEALRDNLSPDLKGEWALDLGAGCGWLSRLLVQLGCRVAALDLNTTGPDSLEGAQVYIGHARAWFGRVQTPMNAPPFAENAFSLCVVSAALHYADIDEVLANVYKVLRPGGVFAVTDSPVYKDEAAGRAMAREQQVRLAELLGHAPETVPGGEGFFVEETLLKRMRAAGFRTKVVHTERLPGTVRRSVRALRGLREHASFPVILGTKE